MRVLIVGDKPSRLNKDTNVPFIGARCEKRLREWLRVLGLEWKDCIFVNTTDKVFKLSLGAFCARPADPIIALGNTAYSASPHHYGNVFKLPHPSGLNRQINNKKFIENQLKACKSWLILNFNHI